MFLLSLPAGNWCVQEPHASARRVDPAAQAVTALCSSGLLASLRGVGCTKSLFAKVSKFVAAFGARGPESGGINASPGQQS